MNHSRPPRHISELFAEGTDAPIRWRWHRMLPVGSLGLLAAYMKVGKSTLAYDLMVSVAKGQPCFGLATEKAPVLLLAAEEHPADVRTRLRHPGATETDPIWVADDLGGDLAQVRSCVEAQGIGFVLIDTMTSFFGDRLKDETDNSELTRALLPLVKLCRDRDVTILLTHHERKSGGDGGRSIRGGSAIFALVDQAFILRRTEGSETRRRLEVEGRYKWDSPGALVLDYTDERYVSLGTPDEQSRTAQRAKLVAALPVDGAPLDIKAWAVAAGIPVPKVRRLAADPETLSQVDRSGSGRKGNPYLYARRASETEHAA